MQLPLGARLAKLLFCVDMGGLRVPQQKYNLQATATQWEWQISSPGGCELFFDFLARVFGITAEAGLGRG